MKALKIISIACLLGMAGSVVAQEGFMPWTDVMMGADLDNSGGVSMSEVKQYQLGGRFQGFQPWMADHFSELDLDNDGEISFFELKKGSMGMEMSDADVSKGFYRGFGFMPANQ